MKTVALLLLVLVGCGRPYNVDPTFEPLVQKFRDASKKVGSPQDARSVSIQFGDLSSVGKETAGFCDNSGAITISKPQWDLLSPVQQELVIFHELGHCVLGRQHSSELSGGLPVSIMYPDISDEYYGYQANPEPFWEELFKN